VVLARTLPDWCGERPLADVAGRFLLVSVLLSLIGSALHAATGLRTALEAAPVFAAGLLLLHPTMGHVCARLATASVLAFIAFGVVAVAFDPLRPYIIKNLDPDVDTAFFNIFWAFLLVPFMARNVRLPDSPFDRHLGNLSFSLYLSHFAVIRILRDLMGGLEGPAIKGLAFLISLLVCVLIYVLLDRPFERLRSAATGRARLAPAT
jgi:peptidoglycan/LPS O-acetylase OafA/YrhL